MSVAKQIDVLDDHEFTLGEPLRDFRAIQIQVAELNLACLSAPVFNHKNEVAVEQRASRHEQRVLARLTVIVTCPVLP